MVCSQFCTLLGFVFVAVALGARLDISSRINNGTPVDTLKRFPSFVSIQSSNRSEEICSGTIIAKRWILTSSRCVAGGPLFEISFHRLYSDSFEGSFSVIVDKSAVVAYPTGYDDLALVKLPISLEFTTELTAAKYAATNLIDNSLAVMAGFGNGTKELTYGMFQLLSLKDCQVAFGTQFDEYLQLCTKSWGFAEQVPCKNNEGGGLIIGWPTNPILVGVFTKADKNCVGETPALYTNVLKYLEWINDVLKYM